MLLLSVAIGVTGSPWSLAQEQHEGAREAALSLNIGDKSAIDRMRQEGKLGAAVARFASSIQKPDRQVSAAALEACRDSGEAAGDANAAISCGLFLAGLYAANGDAPTWARAWAWLRTSGVKLLTNGTGQGSLGNGFDHVDFQEIAGTVPAANYRFTSTNSALKYEVAGDGAPPHVRIRVQGVSVPALVDTGAAATLIVPKDMAERLSLKKVAEGLTVIRTAMPSLDRTNVTIGKDSYYLSDMEMGNLIAKNVLVLVTEKPLKNVVIGNEILSMFGTIRFSDSLELGSPGASVSKCETKVPMHFLPTQQFHGRFVVPAKLLGQTARLGLDSGAGPELTIVGHAAKQFASAPRRAVEATVGGLPIKLDVGSTPIPLSLGSLADLTIDADVVQGPRTNVDAVLGAPLLMRHKALMNFEESYICM